VPRFVINTHFHADHTGGNENLGEPGSALICHTNVRKRLAQGNTVQAFDLVIPPQPKEALPVITFSRDISFHINGETINIEHVPAAHTDGDSIMHFQEANAIHAGDTAFNGFRFSGTTGKLG
jgi:cyclase